MPTVAGSIQGESTETQRLAKRGCFASRCRFPPRPNSLRATLGIGIFSLDNSIPQEYCPSLIHLLGELDWNAAADGGNARRIVPVGERVRAGP